MRAVSYDQIEPNIAEVDSEGNRVKVTWKCPVSGAVVGNSVGYMKADAFAARTRAALNASS